jgi:hypothetical protein
MKRLTTIAMTISAAAWVSATAHAYPGGTPQFQTDVAPFCAGCHSSLTAEALEGAGEQATKQLADHKHLALIEKGEGGYAELTPADRTLLIEQIRAVDLRSKINLEYPPQVDHGQTFQITVTATGGAGPAVGIGLVDRAHRWFAKPASSIGWVVVGAPTVIGSAGPQSDWLGKRPESLGRNVTFVNVTGVESNAATNKWAESKVIWTLRAPDKAGSYPLVGVFFYGTEKASPLGFTTTPLGMKNVRGGFTGGSGRVKFSDPVMINVK